MTTFHWVRHGPTHEKAFVGWRDVPADLSDCAALERLNAFLPDDALLISSDLIRASATADALAAPGRRRLPHDSDLREMDFGAWDGLHWRDVAARDPELSRAYWEKPGDIAAPDGESWNAASARVGGSVDRLLLQHKGANIIAVAHFGAILTQVQRAMSIAAEAAFAHKIDNLSVTSMTHGPDGWRVHQINHVA